MVQPTETFSYFSEAESQTRELASKTNLHASLLMFAENRVLDVSHGLFSDHDLYFFSLGSHQP